MTKKAIPEIKEVIQTAHYSPAIAILTAFEPKMSSKPQILDSLKMTTDKLERELLENYSEEMTTLIIQKLKVLFEDLNFNTHKKSIAVYVSPVFEKVFYLDINVIERIIIDE